MEITVYRARIGLHAARASRRAEPPSRDVLTEVYACAGLCVVAVITGLATGLVVFTVASLSGKATCGLLPALCGQHATDTALLSDFRLPYFGMRRFSVTASAFSEGFVVGTQCIKTLHDLSILLLMSGTVEPNPGPDKLEEAIDSLRAETIRRQDEATEKILSGINSLRLQMTQMEKDMKEMRTEISEMKTKIVAQDEFTELLHDQ